jgi:hypothetical protein
MPNLLFLAESNGFPKVNCQSSESCTKRKIHTPQLKSTSAPNSDSPYTAANQSVSLSAMCPQNSQERAKLTLLKHVWLLGNWLGSPLFSIVNRLGPSEPCKSLNPLTGILEVPVTNCRRRDLRSGGQLRMHCQNHLMTWSSVE